MIHYIATRAVRLADRAVSNDQAIANARRGLTEAQARRREPVDVLASLDRPVPPRRRAR